MSLAPLVSLRNIAKRFANGTEALRGFSLDIHEGGFVSLLGPSGCGKSTVLRLIAGLTDPTEGTVTRTQQDRPLGFVFQDPTLMPWRTVRGNVHLPLRLAGISKTLAIPRIEAALAQVGLQRFAGSYPRQLSGGMKMRVSIARALVMRPTLLLMDEPFAALDEITRARLNDDLLQLRASQRLTIVFVTHSVYESVFLSDRVVVMAQHPGRVIADIQIEAPEIRDEAYRTGELYNRQCRHVSAALRTAMHEQDVAA